MASAAAQSPPGTFGGVKAGSELELKLCQAVLLYRNDHGHRVMATVHGVVQTDANGAPGLSAGQLLSTAALRELTKQLGTSSQAEYLPDNVIARTPELIAWWAPASVRSMFFRQGSELADVSGKLFPHPALLFAVRNNVLFVRALPENKRPLADTKLAAAPYWNIDSNGGLRGDHARSQSVSVASIPISAARFLSERIHPSRRRRPFNHQKGRYHCIVEEPGREETLPTFGTDRNGNRTGLPEKTGGGTTMTHTPAPQLFERLRQGVRREDCPLRVSPYDAHTNLVMYQNIYRC